MEKTKQARKISKIDGLKYNKFVLYLLEILLTNKTPSIRRSYSKNLVSQQSTTIREK
jgi:hypothetical protein